MPAVDIAIRHEKDIQINTVIVRLSGMANIKARFVAAIRDVEARDAAEAIIVRLLRC